MPMTLAFSRSKCFVQSDDNGTKKFTVQANPTARVHVPFWVANTPTFKHGIKDGSITNLTPPEQMPGYKAPVAVAEVPEPTPEELDAADAADGAAEQTEAPQAPFGAQPMTPVAPAPKVGGIRANAKKQ